MICPDCAAAADFEALPGLMKVVNLFDEADEGHDRCVARNLGRASTDCFCQHRTPARPRWARALDVPIGDQQ